MLLSYRYENLPTIVIKLVPCDEHREPLTKSNDVCMVPWLYFMTPNVQTKNYNQNIKPMKKRKTY